MPRNYGFFSNDMIAKRRRPPLAAFFANLLVMGACVGRLMASLVLRFGLGAESLAWLGVFLMAPISAIYYPVDVLPVRLRHITLCFPGAHVEVYE